MALVLFPSSLSSMLTHTVIHICRSHTHTHAGISLMQTHVVLTYLYTSLNCCHAHTYVYMYTQRYSRTYTRAYSYTRIIVNLTSTHISIGTYTQGQLYPSFPLTHTHTHTHERAHTRISHSVGLTHTCTDTHKLDSLCHTYAHKYVGRATGVGLRTAAHVLDSSQFGAMRQPGPHMLGPLVANVVAVQAGVRPPTQPVTQTDTHTQTQKEREATQEHTHEDEYVCIEKDGPRQIHTHGRPVSTWSDHRERETYLSNSLHIHRHTHAHTYT
jgi:hypothetical protein